VSIVSSFPVAVVLAASLVAAVTDVWKYKVHNVLTIPLMIGGVIFHSASGGWPGLVTSLAGLAFGFAVLLPFYAIGGMGAGDVKLLAAVGAWLGVQLTFRAFVASALAGGIYALILVGLAGGTHEASLRLRILWLRLGAFGRHLRPDDRVESAVLHDDRRSRLIPFAAMIAVGVVVTFLHVNGFSAGR
jgi:prepilin peptidase CpaA